MLLASDASNGNNEVRCVLRGPLKTELNYLIKTELDRLKNNDHYVKKIIEV